jgi:hypothetical protein
MPSCQGPRTRPVPGGMGCRSRREPTILERRGIRRRVLVLEGEGCSAPERAECRSSPGRRAEPTKHDLGDLGLRLVTAVATEAGGEALQDRRRSTAIRGFRRTGSSSRAQLLVATVRVARPGRRHSSRRNAEPWQDPGLEQYPDHEKPEHEQQIRHDEVPRRATARRPARSGTSA